MDFESIQSAGNCRFVVKWFKEKHPNEVKFVIDAYGLNSTGIGFSVDKNLVTIILLFFLYFQVQSF